MPSSKRSTPTKAPSQKLTGPPKAAKRGVVAFDMDGTLIDDMGAIAEVAAKVLHDTFETPLDEARLQYLRTTGKPFELQLRELYPEATPFELTNAARIFHETKAKEAYARVTGFADVPRLLKALDRAGWILVIATGAEKEMAEILLEREGIGFMFEAFWGAAQGTKEEHLHEAQRRWPKLPLALVGDSRFDMEAAQRVKGVVPFGRASRLGSWNVTPADLKSWGAVWADYSLVELPGALERHVLKR